MSWLVRHWRKGSAYLIIFGTAASLYFIEPTYPKAFYSIAVTIALTAFLLLIVPRPLFVGVLVFLLTAILQIISGVKQSLMDMGLHAYDLFFYTRWATIKFLWGDHALIVVVSALTLVAFIALGAFLYRFDTVRFPRAWSALVFALALVPITALDAEASKENDFFLFEEVPPLSTFYHSWKETYDALRTGRLIEAHGKPGLANFAAAKTCKSEDGSPLNIVLIHHESVMPPSLFPTLDYDKKLDPFFLSDDGDLHKLHVETYAGGSWLTDLSILAGISTRYSGDMRSFLHVFLKDGIRETLPKTLVNCGYGSVMIYPLSEHFLGVGNFYRAVGYEKVIGNESPEVYKTRERDRFYFDRGLDAMQKHFQSSQKPIFIHLETMGPHSPYDFKFEPQENVSGGGPGTPAEMSEFLRREMLAKIDYEYLHAELLRQFPGKRFLIVRYGDHQPVATRYFFKGALSEKESPLAFITFYAVSGINYAVPPLPKFDSLDISYLGLITLEAAGMPLSDVYRERKRLMRLCDGKYSECSRPDEILAFHQRLIQSGFLKGLTPELPFHTLATPAKAATQPAPAK